MNIEGQEGEEVGAHHPHDLGGERQSQVQAIVGKILNYVLGGIPHSGRPPEINRQHNHRGREGGGQVRGK